MRTLAVQDAAPSEAGLAAGRRLVSGGADGRVCAWDISRGFRRAPALPGVTSVNDLFMYACIHLYFHSFDNLFMYACIHLYFHSFNNLFVYACIHLYIHSFNDLFMYACIRLYIHLFSARRGIRVSGSAAGRGADAHGARRGRREAGADDNARAIVHPPPVLIGHATSLTPY